MRATKPPTLVRLRASCYVGLPDGTAGVIIDQPEKEQRMLATEGKGAFSSESESFVRFEADGSVRQIMDSSLETVSP